MQIGNGERGSRITIPVYLRETASAASLARSLLATAKRVITTERRTRSDETLADASYSKLLDVDSLHLDGVAGE